MVKQAELDRSLNEDGVWYSELS